MGKGNPRVIVRLPRQLHEELLAVVKLRRSRSTKSVHTATSFVVAAIKEKLAHLARSRESSFLAGIRKDSMGQGPCPDHSTENPVS